jgi:hypothetical protein
VDFTLIAYKLLLDSLGDHGFQFQTFADFIKNPKKKTVILRHDVDHLPENSLKIAQIENGFDIPVTYYFRMVKGVYNEEIIRAIAGLGHEIGYHYENLSLFRGKYELAIRNFELNLEKLRKIYPVKTICMHGSPLSKWDNRDLWEKYDYRHFGIIGDPYFDVDFNKVFYLTDTGRRWDGVSVSVRDKVGNQRSAVGGRRSGERWPRFHSTFEIIDAVKTGKFPEKAMITVHPQRWHDRPWPWAKELIWQNIKNVAKRVMLRCRMSDVRCPGGG